MKYKITDITLNNIANALRGKSKLILPSYTLNEMIEAVEQIGVSLYYMDSEWRKYLNMNGNDYILYIRDSLYYSYTGSNLSMISLNNCVTIGNYAFYFCKSLISAHFKTCNKIGTEAFRDCLSLTSISFPVCTTIGSGAFSNCTSLISLYFPSCISIGPSAFYYCYYLESISFPVCTTIGSGAFSICHYLSSTNFPVCTTIGSYAFNACVILKTVSFPACTRISSYAFLRCSSLESVYFLGSSIPYVYSNAFYSTPLSVSTYLTPNRYGSIFVPESLVEAYKSAPGWSYYSSRITAYIQSS